jgi:hypothetical protein
MRRPGSHSGEGWLRCATKPGRAGRVTCLYIYLSDPDDL